MNRYEFTLDKIKQHNRNKLRYETILYPKFEPKDSDYYIITKKLDRLDLIAFDYYGDETLWWVIQRANALDGGTFRVEAGTRLRIPYPLSPIELLNNLTET